MRKFKELTEADFLNSKNRTLIFFYIDCGPIRYRLEKYKKSYGYQILALGLNDYKSRITLAEALAAINAHRREMYEALTEEENV